MYVIETVSFPSSYDGAIHALGCFRAPGNARPLLMPLCPRPDNDAESTRDEYVRRCEELGWHCIFPAFRTGVFRSDGPEIALADIQDAYTWAMEHLSVDHRRIFLIGNGAGGYMALLAAGNMPSLWTAVSAWSPVFDLARWHGECAFRSLPHAARLETVCGGAPGSSPETDARYRAWSPLGTLWRAHIVPVDINAGIHDDHVPAGHGVRAFNELVRATGKLKSAVPEDVIEHIEQERRMPEGFERRRVDDPSYSRMIHLRRVNALSRITVFEGRNEMIHDAAFAWFEGF